MSLVLLLCFYSTSVAQYVTKTEASQYILQQNRPLDLDTIVSIIEYEVIDNFNLSVKLCEVLEDLAIEQNNLIFQHKSFRIRGILYETFQKADTALIFHNKALDIAKKIKGEEGITRSMASMLDIAYSYSQELEYKEAFDWFEKTLEAAIQNDEEEYQLYCLYGIGDIHANVYEFDKAIDAYHKVLELAYQQEDYTSIMVTSSYIAQIHAQAGYEDLAIEAFEEAQNVIKKTSGREKESLSGLYHLYIGEHYMTQGEGSKAIEHFNQAIEYFKKQKDTHQIGRTYLRLGEAAQESDKFELAEEYLKLAFGYKDNLYEEKLADFYNTYGKLSLGKKNYAEALDYFNQSLSVSEPNDFKEVQQESYYGLYQYYLRQNNDKQALFYHLKYIELDSIFTDERQGKALAEMQYKYKMTDKEREIEKLERVNQRTLFIALLSVLLVILIVLFYLYRTRVKHNSLLRNKNEEIQQQYHRLKESHYALEQFTYVAAHDLKEPLRTIGGYSSLLRKRLANVINENQKEYFNFMSTAAQQLSKLLDDLLFYADISKSSPGTDRVELKTSIEDACQKIKNSIVESQAEILFDLQMKMAIKANPSHISLIFKELISNAIRFNDKQPNIEITITTTPSHLKILVKDNGIGLDEAFQNKVFNIFHRLDKTTQGTGVGLTLVKNIVEKYRGSITYFKTTVGTTFEIQLPASLICK